MMMKICWLVVLMAVCVEGQKWANNLVIRPTGTDGSGGVGVASFWFGNIYGTLSPSVTNGELCTYKTDRGGEAIDVDTLCFYTECYAPKRIKSLKFKRGDNYYFSLESFLKTDSITGHWGSNANTILEFRTGVVNHTQATYLFINSKVEEYFDTGRILSFNNLFWKILDTTLHIEHGDTAELTIYNLGVTANRNNSHINTNMHSGDICYIQPGYLLVPDRSRYIIISSLTGRTYTKMRLNGMRENKIKIPVMPIGTYLIQLEIDNTFIRKTIILYQ